MKEKPSNYRIRFIAGELAGRTFAVRNSGTTIGRRRDADLRPGHVIGFSLLVNQRMRDENGDYMVKLDLGGESYCKPANWMDCYLGE